MCSVGHCGGDKIICLKLPPSSDNDLVGKLGQVHTEVMDRSLIRMEPSASLGIAVQSWRGFPRSRGKEQRHGTEPGPHNGWDPDGRGTGSCITEATWVGMHKTHIGDKENT